MSVKGGDDSLVEMLQDQLPVVLAVGRQRFRTFIFLAGWLAS